MEWSKTRELGRSGLTAGRLGVACSYGAPTEAFEEAFDHGINYFYWGSLRKTAMVRAIRHIIGRGRRDGLIIVIQSYCRSPRLMELSCCRGLKRLGIDAADVLLLGWHNRRPSPRLVERALSMKARGMVRALAISGHHRPLMAMLADDPAFDILHVRYNAAHSGAEAEIFARLPPPPSPRPGIVTYTATRWGELLNPARMPPGESPPRGADCYRFALSHPAVDVCVTGPKDLAQMREAMRALELGPLAADELARLRRIGAHVHAHGRLFFP